MSKLNFTSEQYERLFGLIDKLNHISLFSVRNLTGLYDDECYGIIEKYLNNRKRIDKNIDLRESPINDLSQLMYVDGNLDLFDSLITDLSNLTSVTGDLALMYTQIKDLSNLELVGGYLNLKYAPIKELPNLKYVGKELYLSKKNKNIDISHIELKGSVIA